MIIPRPTDLIAPCYKKKGTMQLARKYSADPSIESARNVREATS